VRRAHHLTRQAASSGRGAPYAHVACSGLALRFTWATSAPTV